MYIDYYKIDKCKLLLTINILVYTVKLFVCAEYPGPCLVPLMCIIQIQCKCVGIKWVHT